MPTYPYRCLKCEHRFEQSQRITDEPLKECPMCKGELTREIARTAFLLQGSGWYKDGY